MQKIGFVLVVLSIQMMQAANGRFSQEITTHKDAVAFLGHLLRVDDKACPDDPEWLKASLADMEKNISETEALLASPHRQDAQEIRRQQRMHLAWCKRAHQALSFLLNKVNCKK